MPKSDDSNPGRATETPMLDFINRMPAIPVKPDLEYIPAIGIMIVTAALAATLFYVMWLRKGG